jgi:hypothetical protein
MIYTFVEVDHNVPLPGPCRGSKLKKYPWRTMGVVSGSPARGDSFLVPCAEHEFKQVEASLTSCARWMARRYRMKFTFRRTDDGLRVWRLR